MPNHHELHHHQTIPPMHSIRTVYLAFALTLISACDQSAVENRYRIHSQSIHGGSNKSIGLAIHGYNYTDRVIELFSIDSQGGGNIAVSSPTSGGGKTTCCLRWYLGSELSRPVKIEWMRYKNDKEFWCKKTVMLEAPFPYRPTDVGVHFMPDGNIKVEVTEGYPDLKLSLDRFDPGHRKEENNIVLDEQVAECRYGEQ